MLSNSKANLAKIIYTDAKVMHDKYHEPQSCLALVTRDETENQTVRSL